MSQEGVVLFAVRGRRRVILNLVNDFYVCIMMCYSAI